MSKLRRMTKKECEELKQLCNIATAPPWSVKEKKQAAELHLYTPDGLLFYLHYTDAKDFSVSKEAYFANVRLIATAREALPRLLADVERLRKQVEAGRQAASAIRRHLEMYPKDGSENLTEALAHAREVGLLGSKR